MKKRTVKKVQREARKLARKTVTMVAGLTPAARRKRSRRERTKALVMTTAKLAATEAVMMYREKRAAKLGKEAGKAQAQAEAEGA